MQPETRDSSRHRIFDTYVENSCGPLNDLSAAGMERAAVGERAAGGGHPTPPGRSRGSGR